MAVGAVVRRMSQTTCPNCPATANQPSLSVAGLGDAAWARLEAAQRADLAGTWRQQAQWHSVAAAAGCWS